MRASSSRVVAALVLAISVGGAGVAVNAAEDLAYFVKERQALMKSKGANMKKITEAVEAGATDTATIVEAAQALNTTAKMIPFYFPAGTGIADNIGKTRAKPEIWQRWDEFMVSAHGLERESRKLVEVAQAGDAAAIQAQFEALGKNGCGSCHTPFRAPEQ